jgi:hypothetical protein
MIHCGPRHTQRLDDAIDRGYEPHPDDKRPPAKHLVLPDDDPWMVALAASRAEIAALRDAGVPGVQS